MNELRPGSHYEPPLLERYGNFRELTQKPDPGTDFAMSDGCTESARPGSSASCITS